MFHVARRVVARRPHGVRFCTVKKARAVPKRTLVESKSRFPLKLVGLGLTTGLGVVFYRGDILPDAIQEPANNSIAAIADFFQEQASGVTDYFTTSDNDKLLPDPAPTPYGHPPRKTLVIDLEECLIKQEWDRRYGWRTRKRAGADKFLNHLRQFYEIVIFSNKMFAVAEPIVAQLDPLRCSEHCLYKDSTTRQNGTLVKDLSRLNRNLKDVIVIDDDKACLQLQPENGLYVAPFKGGDEPDDTVLLELIPFLEEIARPNVRDVRDVLKRFDNDASKIAKEYKKLKKKAERLRKRQEQTGLGGMLRRNVKRQAPPKPKPAPKPVAPTPFAAVKPAPVKKVALSLTDSWPPAAAAADYIDPLIPRNPRQAPKHGVGVWRQQPQYVKVLEPSTTEPRQTFWERAEESNKQSAKEMQAHQQAIQEALMRQQQEMKAAAAKAELA